MANIVKYNNKEVSNSNNNIMTTRRRCPIKPNS